MPRSQRRILLAVRLSSGVAPICGSVDLQGFAGLRRTDDRFQHRHAMDRIHRWQRIGGPAVDGTGEGLEFRPLLVELRKFDDLALAFDGADLEPELVAQFGPALRDRKSTRLNSSH